MAILTNPNLAYVMVVVGLTLIFMSQLNKKTKFMNVGMGIVFAATVLAFLYLRINPWVFILVALCPFAFAYSVQEEKSQGQAQKLIRLFAIFTLAIAPFYLFVTQDNEPAASTRWAWTSGVSATILWLSAEGLRNREGERVLSDTLVGMLGETLTDVETHTAGSVLVDGEVWQARSKEGTIPAGSSVRVLRQDGFWLTVKKAGNLPSKEKQ